MIKYESIKKAIRYLMPKKIWLKLIRLKQCFKDYIQKLDNIKIIRKTYKHYSEVERLIKNRKDKFLRFASYVVYDSSFSAYGLMDLMLADPQNFLAKIVVIPDIARGKENLISQYKITKDFFIKNYGKENVLDGYDINTDTFIDLSDKFDIINLANPYDNMVNEIHSIKYLSTKNVLPIYISYGCMPDRYGSKEIISRVEISLFWKVFADNIFTLKDYKRNELTKGKNVICTGYAKMDSLSKEKERSRDRKIIIIAPHHTINNPALPLSNFLEYSDFILELPKLFPSIQFVFRPHPLLFVNLINQKIWTENKVKDYLNKIQEEGYIYSYGGNYFDLFINSDAIIHDCSSFLVEYLYTGKPCCFLAKSNYKKIFTALGKACLNNYYITFNKGQIISFINEIVINNNDKMKIKRNEFTNKYLKINFPFVSNKILDIINIRS